MKKRIFTLGDVKFGDNGRFVLISGPCVIESKKMAIHSAKVIKEIADRLNISYVFKGSYDKANRTSVCSFRGLGIDKSLDILNEIKSVVGVPVLSDVHSVDEIKKVKGVLDIIQIPAFLCRQTDLLLAAGETKKIVNIKKGQFLAPGDMINAVKKVESTGNKNILLTERGSSFGYNNLVSDFRSLAIMKKAGYPIIFDATHSVQQPGGLGLASGGNSEYVPLLSRCAVAAGCDAIFLEVHSNPKKALSDGATMWPLNKLEKLVIELQAIDKIVKKMLT